MIEFQDTEGLVFWPKHQVASLAPEFRGRWRGVMIDGSVAHRPAPPPDGPWVALGNALVMPHLLRRTDAGWADPAGFVFPPCELPTVSLPEPDPTLVPEVGCRADQVFALTASPKGGCLWHTDLGVVRWPKVTVKAAAQTFTHLVPLRAGLYVHRQRLRKVVLHKRRVRVALDNGASYEVSASSATFVQALGLPSLDHLEPFCSEMYGSFQVRDWPCELVQAPAEWLRGTFPTSRMLIANVIWQQMRYLQLGIPQQVATSHRDLWYKLAPVLYRAGFLVLEEVRFTVPEAVDWRALKTGPVAEEQTTEEGLSLTMFIILSKFDHAGLLTYAALGFEDRPDKRRIGSRLPGVVLVVEKDSVAPYAFRLAEEFGVSLLVLSGQPQLIATEFFMSALRKVWSGGGRVIAYTDYDTEGWIIGHATEDQLSEAGLQMEVPVQFLIRGECFTAEEKRLHAYPCSCDTQGQKTKTQAWLKESGGLDGKPFGIHANHVQPYERVRELFVAVLAGGPPARAYPHRRAKKA